MPSALGNALAAYLPPTTGLSPDTLLGVAANVAFQIRDDDPAAVFDGLCDSKRPLRPQEPDEEYVRKLTQRLGETDRRVRYLAQLCITLGAMVDIDQTPAEAMAWLGTKGATNADTIRTERIRAGLASEVAREIRHAVQPNPQDTLGPVTVDSVRELALAAELMHLPHPCGTMAAVARHVEADEPLCARCEQAKALYEAAGPYTRRQMTVRIKKPPQPCGTHAAYVRHRAKGEEPCQPCRVASIQYYAERYDKKLEREGKVRRVGRGHQRKLQPCGTIAAYERHRNGGEDPCQPCRDAKAKYDAARYDEKLAAESRVRKNGKPRKQRPLKPCGTRSAYERHKRRGEEPCEPCIEANTVYCRNRWQDRVSAQAAAEVEQALAAAKTADASVTELPAPGELILDEVAA